VRRTRWGLLQPNWILPVGIYRSGVDLWLCKPCCWASLIDDAEVLAKDFPATLGCGASATASVTVMNSGTSTWTQAGESFYTPCPVICLALFSLRLICRLVSEISVSRYCVLLTSWKIYDKIIITY
jgi:hypothetical protein